MFYPLNLLTNDIRIFPLFDEQLSGEPLVLDLSSDNPKTLDYETDNYDVFQQQIFNEIEKSGYRWAVGPYLEERKNILRAYPQMIEEKRFYHAGLDIIVPPGFVLYAPMDAVVEAVGNEQGVGNYGGYVMLKHEVNRLVFYSFYGHLNSHHLVNEGDSLKAGDSFAKIGEHADSGHWFTHTHLQILTEKAVQQNFMLKGYVTADDLVGLDKLFPSPYFLFRKS